MSQKQSQPETSKPTCSNKHCPQLNYSQGKNGVNQLCPVCAQRYRNDAFCVYCHQVYFETTDDGKNWIQCDGCQGWVHEQCADVFVSRNNPGSNFSYKCIKCKKVESKDVASVARRSNFARTQPKNQKKIESGTFFNIGFSMSLKPEEIAEDMKKLQSFLR